MNAVVAGASMNAGGQETCYQDCTATFGDVECYNYCEKNHSGQGKCRLVTPGHRRCCCLPIL